MKIALSITDLSGGGAARVAAILSNEWVAMGHEVHLITFETRGTAPFFTIDDRVVRHQISAVQSGGSLLGFLVTNIRRVSRLRRLFGTLTPDISIAFLLEANVASVIAAQGLSLRTVIAERNHPGFHRLSASKALLRRIFYRWADVVCVQTREIGEWIAQHLRLKVVVIPNPAPAPTATANAVSFARRHTVLGLGRLEPQKGFDRLVEAFSMVAADHPAWDLTIHGEGTERSALEAQVIRLGLRGRVSLPGVTNDPEAALKAADLFAHTATYEGYPNAIIEAASAGRCILAMDSPGAAREILQEDDCGVLVVNGDIKEFASQLTRLMEAPEIRAEYGARARQRAVKLAPPIIAMRWLEAAVADSPGSMPAKNPATADL